MIWPQIKGCSLDSAFLNTEHWTVKGLGLLRCPERECSKASVRTCWRSPEPGHVHRHTPGLTGMCWIQ